MAESASEAGASGALFVVSGPSGSGKTSLCAALLERCSKLRLSISVTTRAPRPGEVDGVDYHFLDMGSFLSQVEEGSFLEHAIVHGNAYGTRLSDVEALLKEGHDVLLEIDWQGAAQVALRCPDACRIFILPPSIEELRRRLTGRGQDADEVIEQRVAAAEAEIAHAGEADYRIINENFEQALASLLDIYQARTAGRI
jgi:guanylate kinase